MFKTNTPSSVCRMNVDCQRIEGLPYPITKCFFFVSLVFSFPPSDLLGTVLSTDTSCPSNHHFKGKEAIPTLSKNTGTICIHFQVFAVQQNCAMKPNLILSTEKHQEEFHSSGLVVGAIYFNKSYLWSFSFVHLVFIIYLLQVLLCDKKRSIKQGLAIFSSTIKARKDFLEHTCENNSLPGRRGCGLGNTFSCQDLRPWIAV